MNKIRFVLAAVLAVPFPALAQDRVMEEVVVTAQKREQTLQDVPVAVSVVTDETLEQAQINDIVDLQSVVPSLRVTQLQTTGNTNFIIRGFGNGANNAGIEPSVGVFVDGVYRSRSAAALADLPNLERIEVLRGPQSTLFGKNASAGVINIVTGAADPASMAGPEGTVSATAGNYGQFILRGDVSLPLTDTVGASLSGYSNTRDGYFKNLVTGTELNDRDRYGVRGELFFAPASDLTVRLIADIDEIDEQCCGVANLVNGPTGAAVQAVGGNLIPESPFAREQFLDFDPVNDITNSGAQMNIEYGLTDNIGLTSITAYRELDRFENADVDFTGAELIAYNTSETNVETFTQEFRLTGANGPVNWLAGVFYFDEQVKQDTAIGFGPAFRAYADFLSGGGVSATEAALGFPAGTFMAVGQSRSEDAGQDDETWSVFAQADIDLGDRTVLTVGANYTSVEKQAFVDGESTDVFSNLDFVQIGFAGAFSAITGLAPTPDNIAAVPAAAAQADAISMTACSATNPPPACNQLLALQPLQFLLPFQDFPNAVESGISDESKTTWTVRLAHDLTDNINVYASAGTGFKATSWNLSADSRPFPADLAALEAQGLDVVNIYSGTRFAGPEDSTVYEIGLKGVWGRNSLNVAVFDQTIEGFQSNTFTGAAFTLANAGEQSTTGIEVDALWSVTDRFDVAFAATWLDPVYDEFPNSAVGDLSGQRPAGIHDLSMSIAGTYYFDLGPGYGFVRADYLYEDEVQATDNIPASVATREVGTLNASVSYTLADRYEFMLWGRNLTNDDYLLTAFPSVAQAGSISGYPNPPRTWGATFRLRFD